MEFIYKIAKTGEVISSYKEAILLNETGTSVRIEDKCGNEIAYWGEPMNKKMILKNWGLIQNNPSWMAPELRKIRIHGNVYGNPRFTNSTPVDTSSIEKFEINGREIKAITRSGSMYLLRAEYVSPVVEQRYPNYYDRLVRSIQKMICA